MKKRTLVVLFGSDRELDRTYELMRQNLLSPLRGDLTLVGSKSQASSEVKFVQPSIFEEPVDWSKTANAAGLTAELVDQYGSRFPQLLGSIGDEADETKSDWKKSGSGQIVLFWRHQIGQFLKDGDFLNHYDWFVITRSDFIFPVPFFSIDHLDPAHIYVFDGEHHGGICDRFILFHNSIALAVSGVFDEFFENPVSVMKHYEHLDFLNPEMFLYAEMRRQNLASHIRFIPYLAFSIRSPGGKTRWSLGWWEEENQWFVKYPAEAFQTRVFARFIKHSSHWGRFPRSVLSLRPMLSRLIFKTLWSFEWVIPNWIRQNRKRLKKLLKLRQARRHSVQAWHWFKSQFRQGV